MKEIPNIDSSKAIQKFDIPAKSIKGIDIFLRFGYDNFNNFWETRNFPNQLNEKLIRCGTDLYKEIYILEVIKTCQYPT